MLITPYLVSYSASAIAWAVTASFVHHAVLRRRHRAFLPVSLAFTLLRPEGPPPSASPGGTW